jgi:alkanesulfonate monooxygenase SsuD/methylene tetrahydromethanopterin reductase-like flavin-dependent oxidoreductase (luciferase family)
VKLSAFTVVDVAPDAPEDRPDRFGEVVRLAAVADVAGLANFWVAEHHFQDGGVCPSPAVLLGACATVTRRIGVGVLVSVLPFHRPIEVAEQYAMVDRISGGRLRLGLGSGYIPLEFEGFGVDPATKRDRFDRAFESVIAALEGKEVREDAAGASPVRINVRPLQQPHPPVWIAVQRREAIPFVARRGASLALVPYATVPDLEELAAQTREFRSHRPDGARTEVAAAVHLYVGDRPDRARTAFERYLAARLATQSTFYREKARRDPNHASPAALERAGFALFGKAREVAAGLRRYAEAGVDEVLGLFDFGGLTESEAATSVRSLSTELAREAGASTVG